MPEVARKDSIDRVQSPHGSGVCCVNPTVHSTDKGSDNVIVNGHGVVREGDTMIPHLTSDGCCGIHAPPLTTYSSTVFINGKRVGRKGDEYEGGHVIITGSDNVIIG